MKKNIRSKLKTSYTDKILTDTWFQTQECECVYKKVPPAFGFGFLDKIWAEVMKHCGVPGCENTDRSHRLFDNKVKVIVNFS